MIGTTQMGARIGNQFAVDTRFWAASVLLTKKFGDNRVSLRYERFATSENDYLPQDANRENGEALTCNYNYTFLKHHQVNFEISNLSSDRSARFQQGIATGQNQILLQVAYRLFF